MYIVKNNFSFSGLPYVLNVFAKNKAGYTTVKTAPPVVIDISAPFEGKVVCPDYIQVCGFVSDFNEVSN